MLTLLHLLSAVALLVWGTHIVRTGVMRVFGARLRTVLSRSVEKKPLAFCAGIGVTALVQSSNTTMLVTSFVAQDLVALAPALVIVLGADVGTALMALVGENGAGKSTMMKVLTGYPVLTAFSTVPWRSAVPSR